MMSLRTQPGPTDAPAVLRRKRPFPADELPSAIAGEPLDALEFDKMAPVVAVVVRIDALVSGVVEEAVDPDGARDRGNIILVPWIIVRGYGKALLATHGMEVEEMVVPPAAGLLDRVVKLVEGGILPQAELPPDSRLDLFQRHLKLEIGYYGWHRFTF